MGCDESKPKDDKPKDVSIHAPAWGATLAVSLFWGFRLVSIHAPAWGATWLMAQRLTSSTCFNPRTRMGCDTLWRWSGCGRLVSIHAPAWGATAASDDMTCNVKVSIHAPAWGATVWNNDAYIVDMFQSTHPHGVRRSHIITERKISGFQSTHPHGVRPKTFSIKYEFVKSFNPRTRMGCDVDGRLPYMSLAVSIHAPAWGATQLQHALSLLIRVSIHAPAWGATYRE